MMAIFNSVKFLCRQGIAIRRHEDVNSNFRQLLELRKDDVPELQDWMVRTGYTFFSHDILNEIIETLGDAVLREVIAKIKRSDFYALVVDETSDISIHEQVTFCLRTVDEYFEISEDLIGLFETYNTEASTLFENLKDVLIRLDLPTDRLRGQCYDGASNMKGKFNELQKLVLDVQPRATHIHCSAHSLNLAVKQFLIILHVFLNTYESKINTTVDRFMEIIIVSY